MAGHHDRARGAAERVADDATDITELFAAVTEVLERAVPWDGWCGHTLDPATAMPTGGDARSGYQSSLVPRLLEIEYVEGDVNSFSELVQRPVPVGVLHDATAGDPTRSPRYNEVVAPSGFEHELRVVFRHQGRPWGALVLLRAADALAFTPTERAVLAGLSPTLAGAVKRLLLQGYVEAGGVPDHPGLVSLDPEGHVVSMTPEAIRWMGELRDHDGEVPLTVQAVLALARERGGASARSRVRTRSGDWLTLTAWTLGEGVFVSLEPAAPHDLTALALEAYSLSDRERQIVESVLLGRSTAEIARLLFLSPFTVQDHLKAIFDKTGVRSRRELAADLFFRHYLPRIERGTPLHADGWFASGP